MFYRVLADDIWKGDEEVDVERLKEELADVFAFAFLLAHKHHLDVNKIVTDKISLNATRYPINKARGTPKKYTHL